MAVAVSTVLALIAYFSVFIAQVHSAQGFLTVLTSISASSSAPSSSATPRFHHRSYQNSIVVGNHLYIDGGSNTTWNGEGDGIQITLQQSSGNITTFPTTYTYSIDLSSSWDNSTVVQNQIDKSNPVLYTEALWLDAAGKTFYAYEGGTTGYDTDEINPNMYQFTPSGSGGSWSQAPILSTSIFSQLTRATHGYYASGNGLGFSLGGWIWDQTATSTLVSGMAMYNDSSKAWYNASIKGFSDTDTAFNGVAWFVPNFGPEGLLFVFGGREGNDIPISFDSAYIFEPVSKTWHTQTVTGDHPIEVQGQCIVGVPGDNGTYEIFVYGGFSWLNVEGTVALGAVSVLSLPSFHWQRQTAPLSFGRGWHSCNVVGNRQMVSIGGAVVQKDDPESIFYPGVGGSPDPWKLGIGVFDLSDMEWKSSYDATAAPYVTPQMVKDYYDQEGLYPASWDDSVVEGWFTKKGKTQSSPPALAKSSGGSSSPTAAIAAGVVGGIVGLAIICVVAFLLVRRKRRSRNASRHELPNDTREYRSDSKYRHESYQSTELSAKQRPFEVEARPVHELHGGNEERR